MTVLNKKYGLAPVFSEDASVLILGSMPGEESLRRQEYYGYPRNQFWRIIAALTNFEAPDTYPEKIELIINSGIALWDVIGSCKREGSLDTNIKDEDPNPLVELMDSLHSLQAVFFNGQKAESSFKKHIGFDLLDERKLKRYLLPSTSPANTADFDKKLDDWIIIRRFLRKTDML